MNIVTSIGLFDDAIGKRISLTYSQIDDTGKIISDNKFYDPMFESSESEDFRVIGKVRSVVHNM